MPNSRIWEIRALGYAITTKLVMVVGVDGRLRKMALYSLDEPSDAWVKQDTAESLPPVEDCQAFKDWVAADAQKGGA